MKEAAKEYDYLKEHKTNIVGPVIAMKTGSETLSTMNFVKKPRERYDKVSGVYSLAILVEIGREPNQVLWEPSQSIQYRPKLIYENTKGYYIKVGGKSIYLNNNALCLEQQYDSLAKEEDMEQYECPREAFDRYLEHIRKLERTEENYLKK